MYVPKHFAETDVARLHALMRAHAFATLVSVTDGAPFATHVPLLLDAERGGFGTLVGHMARANPHWQAFDGSRPALAIFHGPHAYVSPRWYADKPRVPTWNYAAVHAYGKPRVLEDRGEKHAAMAKLVGEIDPQWKPEFDVMPEDYEDRMLDGIVAFEIPIARIETRWKLSQNRGRDEQERIAARLEESEDSSARALAALTRRHLAPK